MGYEKFLIKGETDKVTLEIDGEKIELEIRKIPWALKSDIRANAITWDNEGVAKLNIGTYVRECLKYMIVTAPWGKTTEMFLITIDDKLGQALENIVPPAYVENEIPRVDEVKKE